MPESPGRTSLYRPTRALGTRATASWLPFKRSFKQHEGNPGSHPCTLQPTLFILPRHKPPRIHPLPHQHTRAEAQTDIKGHSASLLSAWSVKGGFRLLLGVAFSSRDGKRRATRHCQHRDTHQTMSSPPPADSGVPGADEKPRLTEEEKKQNHIASGTSPLPWGSSPPLRRRGCN